MKEKLISRLIVGALAGVAAAGAYAGQIQSSSVSIAREVIVNDSQAIVSPTVSYRFAGDVDARVQTQTFQVQLKLLPSDSGGQPYWASAGAANQIVITDGVSGTVWTQSSTVGNQTYQIVGVPGLDKTTGATILYATIQVDTWTGGTKDVLKQPIITFAGGGTRPTISNLYQVVKPIDPCDTKVYTEKVEVSHFTALSSPAALAVNGVNGVADEHLRGSATNTGTLIVFPTNILVKWAAADGNAKIDVTTSQVSFAGTSTGTLSSFVSASVVNLGKVYLSQYSTGYDTDLVNQYLLTGNPVNTGITQVATAAATNGNVEAASFDVVVTPSNAFVNKGKVYLANTADCAAANTLVTSGAFSATTALNPVTLSVALPQVGMGNSGTNPLYVCYSAPTAAADLSVIPQSNFTASGKLVKAAPGSGAGAKGEQPESCTGALYPLGGSVKIDVRNYANSKDQGGWTSYIRLINTSEVRTIDVYGQLIQVDGKYGPWGKIATLAPRAVTNLSAKVLDAMLTSAPSSTANGDSAPQATGIGSRLRVTSPNSGTLRVQNYLFNPTTGNFIEASSTQGVDFEGSASRAPVSEGQYQDQDAQAGLNGGN